ncbi:hypothetical protein B0H63DRAFT_435353 [Podospora didyma]|uniref:DUF1996 domain-containing protein n=1 Tax=Podospora didyma TaxID=330526 RepID=A0AAE0TWA7_9PEZI|nr:hypothetical protein B0H63DRAFT_435353 [Podospora didyma]
MGVLLWILTSIVVQITAQDCGSRETQAFWVLGCAKPIVVERADPIMEPGRPSNHLHSVMGGDAFDFDLDYAQTQTSNCTTCGITMDLSNYWVPTVYYHAENGSFIDVEQVGGINVYYQERMDWQEYCANMTLQPFPKDFRMIAGNFTLRKYDYRKIEQRAIEFICLPANGEQGLPPFHGFPNRTCGGGLQIRIRFPSCWDGVNVDSVDHKSHVAYPSGIDNGECPETHPVRIPSLLYENTWNVMAFDHLRKPGDQPFVLSQGDPTGCGYHGDFLNGWDIDLLERAIRDPKCGDSNAGGRIQRCPTLRPFLQDGVSQKSCKSIPSKVDEQVFGVLSHLPGCNPIQSDPQGARVYSGNCTVLK